MNQPFYHLTLTHVEDDGTYAELLDVQLPDAASAIVARILEPMIRVFELGVITDAIKKSAGSAEREG